MNVLRCITPKRSHSARSQSGKLSEGLLLRGPRQARLKADQVIGGSRRRSLCAAERPRGACLPVRGSRKPTGLSGPKRRVSSPRSAISFDRQASLEVGLRRRPRSLWGMALERAQVAQSSRILLAVERNVEIVVAVAFLVTRLAIHLRLVDRFGRDDRRSGVVVVEPPSRPAWAAESNASSVGQKLLAGQRPAGNDDRPVARNRPHFFAAD